MRKLSLIKKEIGAEQAINYIVGETASVNNEMQQTMGTVNGFQHNDYRDVAKLLLSMIQRRR